MLVQHTFMRPPASPALALTLTLAMKVRFIVVGTKSDLEAKSVRIRACGGGGEG